MALDRVPVSAKRHEECRTAPGTTALHLHRWSPSQKSAMHAPLHRGLLFDSRQRHFARSFRRARSQRRAAGRHHAGTSHTAEARCVPADAVAATESVARRAGRRSIPGRVIPLLSSDQRHRARRAVQSRLQSRGAGFSAHAYADGRRVRRCRRQCRHLCVAARASRRTARPGDRGRAASGNGRAPRIQSGRIRKRQCRADRGRRGRCRRRTDDRNRPRKLWREPCLSRRQRAQRRDQGAGDAAVAHPAGPQ